MPFRTVYEARTERLEILSPDGEWDAALVPADLTPARVVEAYKLMTRMRRFDEKALLMHPQGRMRTFPSLRGQEAAQAGVALATRQSDWLVPSYREHGVALARGLPFHLVYAFWRGDERGACIPEPLRITPISVPVGSQWLHAAGLGMALRIKPGADDGPDGAIAVGFGGDGSTSQGDFHEALNFAAVFRARTIFFVQNNQWAISVPLRQQMRCETIAQKAHAFGLRGIQVDGNDFFAVYAAVKQAADALRAGEPAVLIEAHTYRLENHTTVDDAKRYRDPAEVEAWRAKDPVLRLRAWLQSRELWSEAEEKAWQAQCGEEVEREVALFEAMAPQNPADLFDYMYKDLPPFLAEQKAELLTEVAR